MKHFNHLWIALWLGFLAVAIPQTRGVVGQAPSTSQESTLPSGSFSQQLTAPKFTNRRAAMLQGWANFGESKAEVSQLLEIGDPEVPEHRSGHPIYEWLSREYSAGTSESPCHVRRGTTPRWTYPQRKRSSATLHGSILPLSRYPCKLF